MSTVFLKFSSKEEFLTKCNELQIVFSNEISSKDFSLSIVGEIIDSSIAPELDEDGNKIYKYISGYHVNAIGDLPETLKKYTVIVNSPMRVFG